MISKSLSEVFQIWFFERKESLEIRKRAEKGEVRSIGQEGAGMRQRAGEGRISQRHREEESEAGTKR